MKPLHILIVVLFLCAATSGQTYHLTVLGTFGGQLSEACAINSSGQVVGDSYLPDGDPITGPPVHAFLYSSGAMTDLGTLGGTFSRATAINAAGQVVGYSLLGAFGASPQHAFLYTDGMMHDLDTLGGDYSVATGINDRGQIVGVGAGHAFLYSDGRMTTLDPLVVPAAINDSGQIVGYGLASDQYGNQSPHAFLYSRGVTTDLGTLGGPTSYATAISASGEVVGSADIANQNARLRNGVGHAFLYSHGVMSDLGTLFVGPLGVPESVANAINCAGDVVGYSIINGVHQHAFLYSDGTMMDLNSLTDNSAAGWVIEDARGINDSGWIVGSATNDPHGTNITFAVLLTPVPEPSAAILVFVAAGGALARRRR